jgi:hypothetical protein
MKADGEVKAQIHFFFKLYNWMVSGQLHAPFASSPGRYFHYPLHMRLCETKRLLVKFEKK